MMQFATKVSVDMNRYRSRDVGLCHSYQSGGCGGDVMVMMVVLMMLMVVVMEIW